MLFIFGNINLALEKKFCSNILCKNTNLRKVHGAVLANTYNFSSICFLPILAELYPEPAKLRMPGDTPTAGGHDHHGGGAIPIMFFGFYIAYIAIALVWDFTQKGRVGSCGKQSGYIIKFREWPMRRYKPPKGLTSKAHRFFGNFYKYILWGIGMFFDCGILMWLGSVLCQFLYFVGLAWGDNFYMGQNIQGNITMYRDLFVYGYMLGILIVAFFINYLIYRSVKGDEGIHKKADAIIEVDPEARKKHSAEKYADEQNFIKNMAYDDRMSYEARKKYNEERLKAVRNKTAMPPKPGTGRTPVQKKE